MQYPSVFPILESKHLRLRACEESDVEEIFNIYKDPRVAEFDDFEPIDNSKEALEIISSYQQQFIEISQIRWGIELKETNRIVGTCGLADFDETNNKCIIGYDLLYAEWNKGIMTEAIKRVTEYAFVTMKLHRIEAYITPGNEASVQVLQKNGYQKEGLLREMEFFKGKYQDGIVCAIIESDFNKLIR